MVGNTYLRLLIIGYYVIAELKATLFAFVSAAIHRAFSTWPFSRLRPVRKERKGTLGSGGLIVC